MIKLDKYKPWAPVLVRISIALVFLWFSINQFIFPNNFVGYVPSWIVETTATSPAMFVIANAILEAIFGIFLLLGLHVRISSLILSLHLFGIAFSLPYGQTMIRDIGLALATLAIFLHGKDKLCIQKN